MGICGMKRLQREEASHVAACVFVCTQFPGWSVSSLIQLVNVCSFFIARVHNLVDHPYIPYIVPYIGRSQARGRQERRYHTTA